MSKKLEVGQTVWVKELKNWSRSKDDRLVETSVKTVGRKWATLEDLPRYSFDIETGKQKPTEYSDSYRVYFDKTIYDREQQELQYRATLREYTANQSAWPIEAVRAVVELIKSQSDF